VKLDFCDDKIMLNKSNLFQRVFAFLQRHFPNDKKRLSEVICLMLNSNKYMIAATLFMNGQGQMQQDAAEAYVNILQGMKCTEIDVVNMIYHPSTRRRYYDSYQRLPEERSQDYAHEQQEPSMPQSHPFDHLPSYVPVLPEDVATGQGGSGLSIVDQEKDLGSDSDSDSESPYNKIKKLISKHKDKLSKHVNKKQHTPSTGKAAGKRKVVAVSSSDDDSVSEDYDDNDNDSFIDDSALEG